MYFTINVWLITPSVDVDTENVTTSVLFLSTSPQCPLTAHVAVGHVSFTSWKKVAGGESSPGQEPVQGTAQLCERSIYFCGPRNCTMRPPFFLQKY